MMRTRAARRTDPFRKRALPSLTDVNTRPMPFYYSCDLVTRSSRVQIARRLLIELDERVANFAERAWRCEDNDKLSSVNSIRVQTTARQRHTSHELTRGAHASIRSENVDRRPTIYDNRRQENEHEGGKTEEITLTPTLQCVLLK